jgi:hypothetical protein
LAQYYWPDAKDYNGNTITPGHADWAYNTNVVPDFNNPWTRPEEPYVANGGSNWIS